MLVELKLCPWTEVGGALGTERKWFFKFVFWEYIAIWNVISNNGYMVFEERGNLQYPEKNLSEQSRERTNLTQKKGARQVNMTWKISMHFPGTNVHWREISTFHATLSFKKKRKKQRKPISEKNFVNDLKRNSTSVHSFKAWSKMKKQHHNTVNLLRMQENYGLLLRAEET